MALPSTRTGFEGLDAESVQGGRAVEQDGALLDDVVKDVPNLRAGPFDEALGALDVVGQAAADQLMHDEGLEELQGHAFRQTAFMQLEVGADDDDGAAGVVDALAEQVLAEAAPASP